jgi:multiple sugar transport system substrate-binding protein
MTVRQQLRGMAWDHPRAVNPLVAISARWSEDKNCAATWDARPLKFFEDQPLEELASRYDLVLIDYPFAGVAAASGLIHAVQEWVDADYLADQANGSVGPSFDSYTWDQRQWALAVDAACQVSGNRIDLLANVGERTPPANWDEVMQLAETLTNDGPRVAMPLNPNHAYCAFLSLGISIAGPEFWLPGAGPDRSAGKQALDYLRAISGFLHPLSRDADPIAISDRMTTTNEILHVPLMFGYSSYSRAGFRPHCIRFGNAPLGASGAIGSVLGGVGIAVSSRSAQPELAADLARLIASRDMQQGLYVSSGGQPGHAAAWESAEANSLVDNFFTATRQTIDQAFMRPRVAGHRRFQVLAGELIHRYVWRNDMTATACLAEYGRLIETLLPDWNDSEEAREAGAA